MSCLWTGLGPVSEPYMAVVWVLHMQQWVLKAKDVITCPCNIKLDYCCLIEC